MWINTNCGKFLKRGDYQTTLPASWKICMQVKKQQLEPDMVQLTGSKLGKEYFKACGEPVWGIPPVTRSWGRKLTYTRHAQTSGAPLEIPKHVPQQKSAGFCALLFFSSDILWKKSIQGFSLLHLKEFQSKNPSDGFLACLQDSYSCACDCLRPPDRRRHRKLKTS